MASSKPACPPSRADGDFYKVALLVDAADQVLLGQVRAFAEERVAPIINQYWGRAEFPFELVRDCRRAIQRFWLPWQECTSRRSHHDGARANRLLDRDIPWCS
jgi:hypothetical protein